MPGGTYGIGNALQEQSCGRFAKIFFQRRGSYENSGWWEEKGQNEEKGHTKVTRRTLAGSQATLVLFICSCLGTDLRDFLHRHLVA